MSWDVILGYFSGLRWLSAHIEPAALVRTVLVVHTCDSVMCWLFARNNGYSKRLWTVLGFFLGIWAVALLIVLPPRQRPGPS